MSMHLHFLFVDSFSTRNYVPITYQLVVSGSKFYLISEFEVLRVILVYM